LVISPEV